MDLARSAASTDYRDADDNAGTGDSPRGALRPADCTRGVRTYGRRNPGALPNDCFAPVSGERREVVLVLRLLSHLPRR